MSCGYCQTSAITHLSEASSAEQIVRALLAAKGFQIPASVPVRLVNRERLKVEAQNGRGDTQGLAKYTRQLRGDTISETHEIFILNHLPKPAFMAVLAHELLHVWCNHHAVKLSRAKLEGFCNLGSMVIYQQDGSPLAQQQLKKMELSKDRIYGSGYRAMRQELEKFGWRQLLSRLSS